jgi:hypothetical protein
MTSVVATPWHGGCSPVLSYRTFPRCIAWQNPFGISSASKYPLQVYFSHERPFEGENKFKPGRDRSRAAQDNVLDSVAVLFPCCSECFSRVFYQNKRSRHDQYTKQARLTGAASISDCVRARSWIVLQKITHIDHRYGRRLTVFW